MDIMCKLNFFLYVVHEFAECSPPQELTIGVVMPNEGPYSFSQFGIAIDLAIADAQKNGIMNATNIRYFDN